MDWYQKLFGHPDPFGIWIIDLYTAGLIVFILLILFGA